MSTATIAIMVDMTLRTSRWRLWLALAFGALASWAFAPGASAHAAYESSVPAFAEVLSEAPTEISIRFTQELFRHDGANDMTLKQISGDQVSEWELSVAEISNDDRHVMRASVGSALPPGRYLVRWINLSAEDGDTDSGLFPFYVSRQPTADEIVLDRELAVELLVAYPGDDVADESASPAVAISATPTVLRSDTSAMVSLGIGPVVWLVVGVIAAFALATVLAVRLLIQRRLE